MDYKGLKEKIMNILFVCTGNTCRSPMAEFVMKDMVSKITGKRVILPRTLLARSIMELID